jgi:hypothetical protein
MFFNEFLSITPSALHDKWGVSLSPGLVTPAVAADRFQETGMLQFREVFNPHIINDYRSEAIRYGQLLFQQSLPNTVNLEYESYLSGDANKLWEPRTERGFCFSTLIPFLIKSWVWPIIENICSSEDIVIFVSMSYLRHVTDLNLGIGAHQDAAGFETEIPIAMWLPLQKIIPKETTGLGFFIGAPKHVLKHTNGDIGEEYFLSRGSDAFLPEYQVGDLSIHHMFTPHFTTGFGTLNERFSIELRFIGADKAPRELQDPAFLIKRVNGEPLIVESRISSSHPAVEFLKSVVSVQNVD